MDKQDINRLLMEAKQVLRSAEPDAEDAQTPLSEKSANDYSNITLRIFGANPNNKQLPAPPVDADTVINQVRQAPKKSTISKYARAVRYVALEMLGYLIKSADLAQRKGMWNEVERLVSYRSFLPLLTLAKMLPAEYRQDWTAQASRKSKKTSLRRLAKDWREQMAAAAPDGQFRIPMLVALMTGVRVAELEYGVVLKRNGSKLYAHIKGAKVTRHAGQAYRMFRIAEHPIKDLILRHMDEQQDKNHLMVKVEIGNSVTTYMRDLGKKLWPKHKEKITVYTARHAMAADCKQASAEGADPDLVSKVLGHRVDKTASYYGDIAQSGGISVAPTNIKVPFEIRNKAKARNSSRKTPSHLKKSRRSRGNSSSL